MIWWLEDFLATDFFIFILVTWQYFKHSLSYHLSQFGIYYVMVYVPQLRVITLNWTFHAFCFLMTYKFIASLIINFSSAGNHFFGLVLGSHNMISLPLTLNGPHHQFVLSAEDTWFQSMNKTIPYLCFQYKIMNFKMLLLMLFHLQIK